MGGRLRVAVAVGVVLALGVGVLAYVHSRDDTTPVSVGDALSGFRSDGAKAGERTRSGAVAGVYVYSTAGYEHVGGTFSSRHDYPRTSTVTVTETPCGTRERWEVLAERQNTTETCTGERRTRLRSIDDHHEFFGQVRDARFDCGRRSVPRPDRMEPGLTWTTGCRTDEGDAMRIAATIRGRGETDVGGQAVPSVHMRIVSTLHGSFRGGNVIDSWLRRPDGLLLRRRQLADMSIDTPIGDAPYRERYEIRLRSLDPRR